MSSWPYQKLSEYSQETWDKGTVKKQVAKVAVAMMMSEYCCVLAFFFAGLYGWEKTATGFQILFLLFAATVEVISWKKMGRPWKNEKVKSILGVPVECLGIPKPIYLLITLAPNYVHVISSAVAAGVSYIVWLKPPLGNAEDLHADHERNWHDTPLIGDFVARHGIPDCLSLLLVASICWHVVIPILWFLLFGLLDGEFALDEFIVGELCDCANLQFLKKALYELEGGGAFQLSRLALALLIKYPLLWAKTSFLAVMWEYMDGSMKVSMLVAILLAWYGILQLMPTFFWQTYLLLEGFAQLELSGKVIGVFSALCTVILVGGLSQQFLHLGGIWWCPATHDFSILHGGCTIAG